VRTTLGSLHTPAAAAIDDAAIANSANRLKRINVSSRIEGDNKDSAL